MKNKKLSISKKVNLIYSIFQTIFTIVMGIFFILHISEIYYSGLESNSDIYTREIVNAHLLQLLIPSILWILSIIGGFIISCIFKVNVPTKVLLSTYNQVKHFETLISDDIKNDSDYIFIKKEKTSRLIAKIITISISVISSIICLVYLLNINNFLKDGDLSAQVINMIKFVLPWFFISIIACIGLTTYYLFSSKKELVYLKKLYPQYKIESHRKNISNRKLLIIRLSILVISITFIVLGIFNEGMRNVFIKAVNLCTECIGLG